MDELQSSFLLCELFVATRGGKGCFTPFKQIVPKALVLSAVVTNEVLGNDHYKWSIRGELAPGYPVLDVNVWMQWIIKSELCS